MLISYPSFLRNIPDLRKNSMIGSIGYHLIPGRTPLLGGWSLGSISILQTKKKHFSFLKWTCEEQTANYTTLLGGLTVLTNTYVNDELSDLYPWLPLYYSIYQYTKPVIPPKLLNNKVIPQWEIDEVVCKWLYKLLDSEIEVRETISETQKSFADTGKAISIKKIAVKDFFSHFTAIFLSHGTSSCPSIAAYDPASFHPDRSGYSSSSVQPGLQWHKYLRLYLRKNLLSCLRVQNQDGENFFGAMISLLDIQSHEFFAF